MKKITIEANENICSDLADIICFLGGYVEAKGEEWRYKWLDESIDSLRELNRVIKLEIKTNN